MIIVLAGRRIDANDTDTIRFPMDKVEKVKQKLIKFFIEGKPGYLLCSGACGADLIALDVAGQLHIPRKMILPFGADIFRSQSVIDRPGDWGNLFDHIYEDLNKNQNVIILNYKQDDENAYEKTNFEILKLADSMYEQSKHETNQSFNLPAEKKVAIIIWEGAPKDSNDTTDHFREEAKKRNYEIEEINCLN